MATTSIFGSKLATAALVALSLGAGVTLQAGEAEARFGRKGLIAAGVVGALVTGAIVASANNARAQRYHAEPDYDAGYVPAPVYQQPEPVYEDVEPVYYRQPQPGYYGHPGYGYQPPRRHHRNRYAGYSETGFAYRGPVCTLKKQQVWTGYGYAWQKVQVCR